MFISTSSLTLTSRPISGNPHSARAYPFPGSPPLSSFLAPPPNQSSTPSFSYTPSPGPRSTQPSEFLSTMPLSGTVGHPYYLTRFGIIAPSSPSISSTSDLPEPTPDTSTSAGTSPPPSSAFNSNSGVSASLTSRLTTSGTMLPSSWSTLSSPLSTDPLSTSGFTPTATPTSTLPFPIPLTTQTSSSSMPVSSYSPSQHTSLSFPSSPASMSSTSFSASVTAKSPSAAPDSTTTVVVSTTMVTSLSPPPSSPSTSTYTITSFLLGQGGTTTDIVTSSIGLSTETPGSTLDGAVPISPGAIAAIVLGIVGAFAFAAFWLFCAHRRHRKLAQEAALAPSVNPAPGPLDDEILDVDELRYGIGRTYNTGDPMSQTRPTMEERYAGILAALHFTERFGTGNEGGSTGGVYGSRHDTATDMEEVDDATRASSPTLPFDAIPTDDPPYLTPLSPPPASLPLYHQTTQPTPPPSAYLMSSRRQSSPGPDVAAYSVAPSCNSHYARSQTLGSGSGSGSVDALTRTRTGSEEPLLGIGKVTVEMTAGIPSSGGISVGTDPGSNQLGLGSAFGSPTTSMYSPSSVHPTLHCDTSGSYDARTASGSGSYGYARSGTPSSFDVLRSVSSQGALSSTYSHSRGQGRGFGFGFGRPGSSSSGSTGNRAGSGQHSFGVPPTSFRAWKDWGSTASDKEKQSLKEKESRERNRSPTSASNSESMDEKQARGSPVVGVRALLGRLRLGGHSPSPHSSNKDLSSPTKAFTDVDPEKAAADRVTPPPIEVQVATPQRSRFSFILSNPDPHPTQHDAPACDPHESYLTPFSVGQPATPFPTGCVPTSAPSLAPTEESHLAEGLLHPRLQTQGCSDGSLRDFEDYSRPIGGVVKNRLYSTTTFGTQDDAEGRTPSQGTPVKDGVPGDENDHEEEVIDVFGPSPYRGIPRDSWFFNDPSQSMAPRHSTEGT